MQQYLLIRLPNEVILHGSDSFLFVSIFLLFKLIERHSNHMNSPLRDANCHLYIHLILIQLLCLLLISLY